MGADRLSLTEAKVRRLAGSKTFDRGTEYYFAGQVSSVEETPSGISARVLGSASEYEVSLSADGHACTCRHGQDGKFCKHCVAAALAWLFKGTTAKPAKRKLTLEDAAAALDKDDKQTIVGMLLGWAPSDFALQERLLQYAARRTGPETAVAAAKQAFSDAVTIRGFLHYRQARDWARAVDAAIDNVDELLGDGHAAAVVDLCQWALGRLERAVERMDDSDGHFRFLQQRVESIHLEACRRAKPDPIALAKRLFQFELKSEWDTLDQAALRYADVLGEDGLAAYRKLIAPEWDKVPQRGPDELPVTDHLRITRMMEALAKTTGDVEQVVDVLRRDLSGPHAYYRIAEAYVSAGRYDQALLWGERGLELFSAGREERLRELVADEYYRRGEHDAAIELAWKAFNRSRAWQATEHWSGMRRGREPGRFGATGL